ncbi:MAG: TonB-dependent receptor [Proteobacteria bacterium]|nr:TonB-dependent receptor [Pseudomonadota bacterium]
MQRAVRHARAWSGVWLLGACSGWVLAQPVPDHLSEVTVRAHYDNAVGSTDAASQGRVQAGLLADRPLLRPSDALEAVPGLVVTQHSGDGKANQYFLRGFNLDHGTDFATTVNGVPVNMPTHAHGQGYSDLNFLIPELVDHIDYRKGPYFAPYGDFASAGAADIAYATRLERPFASLTLGAHNFRRALLAGSGERSDGTRWLGGLELAGNDGPWTVPERLRKLNGVLNLSGGSAREGWTATAMGYDAHWTATDQVPERLIGQAWQGRRFGRFDAVDLTDGGRSARYSLSGEWHRSTGSTTDRLAVWALHSRLTLFSNFTYFTQGPQGDQFSQRESRNALGFSGSRSWAHRMAGADAQTTLGVQLRHDQVQLGLLRSTARAITDTVRDDRVGQTQAGLYAENAAQWTPWLRTVLGLRADTLIARVRSHVLTANSGHSDDLTLSPKASLVLEPWAHTEFFVNAGRGFHSNDARGTTIRVDPTAPTRAAEQVPGLVPNLGYELGLRGQWLPGLQTSLALWWLRSRSELVYVGDAGTTEPGQASRRRGVEWNTRYTPWRGVVLDADLAWTHARFADGSHIDNAVDRVSVLSVTLGQGPGWSATLGWRYIGSATLTGDNSQRSRPSRTANLRIGYAPQGARWSLTLDVFNLFNRRNDDISYWYASRLPGEASDVEGLHVHPAEPRTARVVWRLAL